MIAGNQPALGGRGIREDLLDHHLIVLLPDRHAQAGVVVPQGVPLEGGQLLRRIEVGVRVLEVLDQTARRLFIYRAATQGIDRIVLDSLQNLRKQSRPIGELLILENERAPHERQSRQGTP